MGEGISASGWLFLHPSAVPEEWKERGRPAVFVALDEEEVVSLLRSGSIHKSVHADEEEFLSLVARGLSAREIARRLGRSERTVHRLLAQFRERYGVLSTSELVAELAKRGFQ